MNVAWNSVWKESTSSMKYVGEPYKETKFQGKDVNGGKSWWGDMVEYNWYYTDYMWPWTAPISETQKNPNLTKRSGWAY